MGVGGYGYSLGVLPRERDQVPIVQESGWAPEPVWTSEETLATTGIRSPDSPGRSECLYRLRYPGPWRRKQNAQLRWKNICPTFSSSSFFLSAGSFYLIIVHRYRGLLLHVITHNDTLTLGRTPLHEWSARRRCLYLQQHTKLHACRGNRTRNLSKRAAAGLRPCGHWYRPYNLSGLN